MGVQYNNSPKCQLTYTNLSCPDGPVVSFSPTHTTKIAEELPRTRFSRLQWVLLILLGLSNFCVGAIFAVQAPFFPQEAEKKGATPAEYGLVFGIYQLTVLLASPVFGQLNRHVSPSFMLNSGLFVLGTSTILFGILDGAPNGRPFIAAAFAIRITEGLGCAATRTATNTIIAKNFPTSVATAFAILETFLGAGVMVSPTLGGLLYELGGFKLPFVAFGCLLLLIEVTLYFFLPDSEGGSVPRVKNFWKLYASPEIILDGLTIVTSFIFVGYIQATLEPHLRQFNLTPVAVGGVIVSSGTVYAITAPVWGYMCDRLSDAKPLTLVASLIVCLSISFMGPLPVFQSGTQLWLIVLAQVLLGLGNGCKCVAPFGSALKNALRRGYPDDLSTYGMVSALYTSSEALGAFIGPSIGGYILGSVGFRKGTTIMLVQELMFVGLLLIFIIFKKVRKDKVTRCPENKPLL
ncbi:MFS-type transporter SLC18B1-like [Limulus polyphemus]|uniref:MFS-type transporter SLC18B1-like n=1 Tax=Limulus polyphemus TaxID=6850 RepID=A0ABM1TKW6_LIMPO|nr:MFS-type transporter SLC18B1-like [Limulus polyphemus]